jgi:hypothetical protein
MWSGVQYFLSLAIKSELGYTLRYHAGSYLEFLHQHLSSRDVFCTSSKGNPLAFTGIFRLLGLYPFAVEKISVTLRKEVNTVSVCSISHSALLTPSSLKFGLKRE